jgi:hypothetical protein
MASFSQTASATPFDTSQHPRRKLASFFQTRASTKLDTTLQPWLRLAKLRSPSVCIRVHPWLTPSFTLP